jgi:hypothetical protein
MNLIIDLLDVCYRIIVIQIFPGFFQARDRVMNHTGGPRLTRNKYMFKVLIFYIKKDFEIIHMDISY